MLGILLQCFMENFHLFSMTDEDISYEIVSRCLLAFDISAKNFFILPEKRELKKCEISSYLLIH